jgi:hypothetical protein
MKPLYGKVVNLILDAEKEIFNKKEDLFLEKLLYLTNIKHFPC